MTSNKELRQKLFMWIVKYSFIQLEKNKIVHMPSANYLHKDYWYKQETKNTNVILSLISIRFSHQGFNSKFQYSNICIKLNGILFGHFTRTPLKYFTYIFKHNMARINEYNETYMKVWDYIIFHCMSKPLSNSGRPFSFSFLCANP